VKKVYSSDNFVMAGHIHSLLEANNIDCHLRNMNLTGGIGELPINECWPEVWVNDDSDVTHARQLIETALSIKTENEAWRCNCGEQIEGQFELCWACGEEKNSLNVS
jgi:Putative prokaryotic signal transducing protein